MTTKSQSYSTFLPRLKALFSKNKKLPDGFRSLYEHNVERSAVVRLLVASDDDNRNYRAFAQAEAEFYQAPVREHYEGVLKDLVKELEDIKAKCYKPIDYIMESLIKHETFSIGAFDDMEECAKYKREEFQLIADFMVLSDSVGQYYFLIFLAIWTKKWKYDLEKLIKDHPLTQVQHKLVNEFKDNGDAMLKKNRERVNRWIPDLE